MPAVTRRSKVQIHIQIVLALVFDFLRCKQTEGTTLLITVAITCFVAGQILASFLFVNNILADIKLYKFQQYVIYKGVLHTCPTDTCIHLYTSEAILYEISNALPKGTKVSEVQTLYPWSASQTL